MRLSGHAVPFRLLRYFSLAGLLSIVIATVGLAFVYRHFVTASSEIDDESKGFEAGAVDYILKPVRAPIVKARVRTQLALADMFDALTTERPNKKAWPVEEALDLIRRERERHFDPAVADTFLGVLPEILRIREQYAETGPEAGPRRPDPRAMRDNEGAACAAAQ